MVRCVDRGAQQGKSWKLQVSDGKRGRLAEWNECRFRFSLLWLLLRERLLLRIWTLA